MMKMYIHVVILFEIKIRKKKNTKKTMDASHGYTPKLLNVYTENLLNIF